MARVIETRLIAQAPDALWREIGRFGAVGLWHPMLSRVESEGEHEGGLRMAEGKDGSRQIERLVKTDSERHFYRYRMEFTPMPVRDYVAEFRIDANADGTSTVVWSAEFAPLSDDEGTTNVISGFLNAGLDNIATLYGNAPIADQGRTRTTQRNFFTCRTKELEVAYEVSGPADGRPLVLVHGWPDDVTCWDKTIARLGDRDLRIYAPYLRGSGPTRFLADSTMRSGAIAALTLDLTEFLDVLDLKNVVLAGYDWGARAAYGVAALFPDRLTGIVAAAAGYATAIPPAEMPYELAHAYWYEWYVATTYGHRAYRDDRERLCRYLWESWSPAWPDRDTEFDAMAGSLNNPDWADISLHAYRQRWHDAAGANGHEEVERRLAESPTIRIRTIMLQGAEDGDNMPVTSENKERYFSGGYERRLLPGVGHFVPREAPDDFADAICAVAKR
ncbi:alpha/beta fold hydrolase [Paraburkholderia diazotrophica]|uniref:Pimeloyl-ACP methyl ester carboxylesterase n=1 Tax=Paraburkholderia diazotrophica TaxID=667676 RepID=A0A1H7DUU0_9BURK|nr:alpha/beta fold hydrolase [Paraburkholderia diazotrophica]SEK05539.1 Pimeloyl-ACP methyl ester carboxylesterase [Paraburkholderia diazotrophica]